MNNNSDSKSALSNYTKNADKTKSSSAKNIVIHERKLRHTAKNSTKAKENENEATKNRDDNPDANGNNQGMLQPVEN